MKKHYAVKTASYAAMYFVFGILMIISLTILIPTVSGMKIFSIKTGSMSPVIKQNALIFVSTKNAEDFKKDDVVTFYTKSRAVVTHRIVACDFEKDIIITKGDANSVSDARIKYSDVIGKVVFSIPNIGGLIAFFKTVPGIILLISVPALGVALNGLIQKSENEKILAAIKCG